AMKILFVTEEANQIQAGKCILHGINASFNTKPNRHNDNVIYVISRYENLSINWYRPS
ncbi:18150_t:CDS:2, partial [Gigaspora rosea]